MSLIYKWLAFHPVLVAFSFLAVCWTLATCIVGPANPGHVHDIATVLGVFGGLAVSKTIQYRYYLGHRNPPDGKLAQQAATTRQMTRMMAGISKTHTSA